jgi:nucleoside-diphosphate-sugar epimerase
LKKILITGAGGFIGKNLCKNLENSNYKIISLCRNPFKNNSKTLEILGDITDEKLIAKISSDIDIIVHLAAYLDVKQSFTNLDEVFRTNIQGTFNIVKHISRLAKKPHFIFMSTSTVYGNGKTSPIKESSLSDPRTPYSMSKASCEIICHGFANSHDIPITILRPFSVYGLDGPSHQAIPRIIRQIKKENAIIQDNPNEIRDFVYVDDVVEAIVKVIKSKPPKFQIYNIGSGKGTSMLELLSTMSKICNREITIKKGSITEINKRRSIADITLIKKNLNWKPKTVLAKGLEKILQQELSD